MRYGIVLPNVGGCGDPHVLAELAHQAEDSGWDGVFLFDSVMSPVWDGFFAKDPEKRATADPWIALTAMALRTKRVVLGPMITPVTRRRPWKLARETVTLDHLSGGRLVLPVGLGSIDDGGFACVGEETDRKLRADRLDEGLEILAGLWSGEPFRFSGKHFQIDEMTFLPKPVQSPRIPVWVVGLWPYERSLRRAARWDGIVPAKKNEKEGEDSLSLEPDELREMCAFVEKHRASSGPYEVVIEGETSGGDRARAVARVEPFAEAGGTWWLESVWTRALKPPQTLDRVRTRIRQGPPRVR